MEEEFYIWQTSVEELDEGEVNILMDTIEDGLMLTYSNGFEETICKLKFKKGTFNLNTFRLVARV